MKLTYNLNLLNFEFSACYSLEKSKCVRLLWIQKNFP